MFFFLAFAKNLLPELDEQFTRGGCLLVSICRIGEQKLITCAKNMSLVVTGEKKQSLPKFGMLDSNRFHGTGFFTRFAIKIKTHENEYTFAESKNAVRFFW